MRTHHPDVAWPLEYREVAADPAWLSPAHARDVVTISAHQATDLPFEVFFKNVERVCRAHGGRPHWGKLHTAAGADLAALYPRFADFCALARRLDPSGRFRSPYLRELGFA
jgi:L-gulonolactone oxidase